MSRFPDSTVITKDGVVPAMPRIRKYFIMLGKDGKPLQHECLYEGSAGFKMLADHVINAQITINEDEPRKEGDLYKDIENTPVGLPIDFIVPREQLMQSNKLWRYMNLSKFEDIIKNKQLYYSRLDGFSDLLEGSAPDSCVDAISNDPEKNDVQKQEALRLFKIRMENNRKVSFALCWHINENLNFDMWKEYGQNSPQSFAIQTSVARLERATRRSKLPILNEPVRYFVEPYFNQSAYWFPTMFKRSSFSYEQEFRSIFFVHGADQKGLRIPINPEDLITKIYIHPDASNAFFKEVRMMVKSAGLKIPIARAEIK